MTLTSRLGIALIAGFAATAPVFAQNHNGTLNTAFYGAAKAVQTNATGFGDANTTTTSAANGSELDALYGRLDNGALHLFLSGNLESNFNKLELFFDTGAAGQHVLRNDNASGALNGMAGLTLPSGFNASRYITVGGGGTPYVMYGDFATLTPTGGGISRYLGFNSATTNAVANDPNPANGSANPDNIQFTINNSNVAGVTGTTASAAAAAAVLTGVELKIPYSALGGAPLNGVKVFAFINGSNHDFASNQSLGGLPSGTANPGGTFANVNFTTLGASSVTVVPEAGSGVLALVPALGMVAGVVLRNRRK